MTKVTRPSGTVLPRWRSVTPVLSKNEICAHADCHEEDLLFEIRTYSSLPLTMQRSATGGKQHRQHVARPNMAHSHTSLCVLRDRVMSPVLFEQVLKHSGSEQVLLISHFCFRRSVGGRLQQQIVVILTSPCFGFVGCEWVARNGRPRARQRTTSEAPSARPLLHTSITDTKRQKRTRRGAQQTLSHGWHAPCAESALSITQRDL